jgi:site-specific recombinase XerD
MGETAFVNQDNQPLKRRRLLENIQYVGKKAGVVDVTIHRFRHTFAINYLRNGGDVYTLQRILGHTTLSMVKRYLAIAQADVEKAHRKASPVAKWGL